MTGIDAEIGTTLFTYKPWFLSLYGAAGPYHYVDSARRTTGGQARAALSCGSYIGLEVNGSYGNLFNGIVQGKLAINIPLGPYQQPDTCCRSFSQAFQPVQRQEIIVIDHKKTKSPAIDPRTGHPYSFLFVDNISSTSFGTYENPFSTLKEAQSYSNPGDKIYVFPGNGTSSGMDQGIVLKNRQALWGASVSHGLLTTQGAFAIPAQASYMPMITFTLGSAVTLANDNEVSGLNIANSTKGIFGKNITNANINRNVFTMTTALAALANPFIIDHSTDSELALDRVNGIELQNPSGFFAITQNQYPTDVNMTIGILIRDINRCQSE